MRSTNVLALALAPALACGASLSTGCDGGAPADNADDIRPRSSPIEFVGLTLERPITTEADFLAIVDPILGSAAREGRGHREMELQRGLFVTVLPDDRTPEQAVVTLEMQPSQPADAMRRTILEVPISYEYGAVYIEAVRAALERTQEVGAGMEPYHLEYHVLSVNGGDLVIQTEYTPEAGAVVRLRTSAPRTSLVPGQINHAAFSGQPVESVGGTVWFELGRDEFSFFSNRAYGATSSAAQNFSDFQLLPHDWLRLTVTPRLEDDVVDVGFEVITVDGRRVPFARAPASLLGGEQFQQNVFRMVDNMNAQERETPGSSTPFEVPFYYDDPEGGGTVSVIANGRDGVFRIAYAVESPTHRLEDVSFVPYQGVVEIPDTMPPRRTSCEEMGSIDALQGRFHLRFDASSTVRRSPNLTTPLRGPVWGDIYRASDVTIGGPREGAEAVAQFHFDEVDLTGGASAEEFVVDGPFAAGVEYQILGFMDVDGNATEGDAGPDDYDPVFIPIGGYPMDCADQHVVVEFALLLPPGR
ncbi:MAG: hypothetical protein J0L92_10060 [Deltaproteobacteria bacterium]|nr:hypothetical protein [Deltaproteobacteria bacterium]